VNNFLGKLGSYHILTNIIPGAFFVLLSRHLFGIAIATENTVEDVMLFYFTGLLISRVGSLVVTPFLRREWGKKKCVFILYADYTNFLRATKADPKIEVLSETNDGFRNLLTCSVLLLIVEPARVMIQQTPLYTGWKWAAVPILIVIFLFAYREQTEHIRDRVKAVLNQEVATDSLL
jgi:hypothetical protein